MVLLVAYFSVVARYGAGLGHSNAIGQEVADMAMRWYVVHAYSGFEDQVKRRWKSVLSV